MVANLNQNPSTRPICSKLVPTLLRQGVMWVINRNSQTDASAAAEERMLLPKERFTLDFG